MTPKKRRGRRSAAGSNALTRSPYAITICGSRIRRCLHRRIVLSEALQSSADHGSAALRSGEGDLTERRLLQRRPVYARIRLRHLLSLFAVRRRNAPFRAGLSEQSIVQKRERPGGYES